MDYAVLNNQIWRSRSFGNSFLKFTHWANIGTGRVWPAWEEDWESWLCVLCILDLAGNSGGPLKECLRNQQTTLDLCPLPYQYLQRQTRLVATHGLLRLTIVKVQCLPLVLPSLPCGNFKKFSSICAFACAFLRTFPTLSRGWPLLAS